MPLNDFNSIHPKLHFMEETEQNNKINYLHITIHKNPTNVSISVFRKPTYTDTLLPFTSNHPVQHKYVAVKFLYNSLNSYHLQDKEHQQEKTLSRVYYIFPSQ
jgi:RecG-like helicase